MSSPPVTLTNPYASAIFYVLEDVATRLKAALATAYPAIDVVMDARRRHELDSAILGRVVMYPLTEQYAGAKRTSSVHERQIATKIVTVEARIQAMSWQEIDGVILPAFVKALRDSKLTSANVKSGQWVTQQQPAEGYDGHLYSLQFEIVASVNEYLGTARPLKAEVDTELLGPSGSAETVDSFEVPLCQTKKKKLRDARVQAHGAPS